MYTSSESLVRPGSSMPRLIQFALLLRAHPTVTLSIEGHASTIEGNACGCELQTEISKRRAEVVHAELLGLECLESLGHSGNRVWGRLPYFCGCGVKAPVTLRLLSVEACPSPHAARSMLRAFCSQRADSLASRAPRSS